ncbi:DNA (cytosine-5-)-methyltransferase [Prochlorococcus sp. AH-716-E13]|nr:DNA (cytosine-5-)-methyltransferase [Prochlorococcus sp. AH-716-E13]
MENTLLQPKDLIKQRRETLGLTQKEFAYLLNLKESGDRTISGWERGEHSPTEAKLKIIENLSTLIPFKKRTERSDFTFIDLFAGIGGIRLPFQNLGGECLFSSEWDKFSIKTYAANFGELPKGDISKISSNEIPSHDILLAGFPCQAFSQAGLRKGFADTRGTMFFEIQRILAAKQPKAFLLENVKQLKGHDKGKTLKTILEILRGENDLNIPDDYPVSEEVRNSMNKKLNYAVDFKVLRANNFGVPQKRERIYIVGFNREFFDESVDLDKKVSEMFSYLENKRSSTRLGDILENNSIIEPKYTISDRLLAGHIRRRKEHKIKGNGFGYSLFNVDSSFCNTISARYYKDGSEILIDQSDIDKNPRKLTPRECARIQGFPDEFLVNAVSDVQIYKQFGNSVSVPVIREIAKKILEILREK